MRTGFGIGALAALVGSTLTGCGGSTEGPGSSKGAPTASGPRIVLVTNSNSDYWSAVEKGLNDGAAKFGANVEMKRNDGTTEGQIRLLEEALSIPDVKGVAVSPIEAEAVGIADALRKLKDAGKKVISIDSDLTPSAADSRLAYIGTNNTKAGEAAGKAAAMIRPDGGKTAIFVATSSATNAIERMTGFFEAAGPKFAKIETFEDGADMNKAQTLVGTALTKYPDVGVLLGLYSYNGPRIAEEVSRSPEIRKKVLVVTFDLDEQAIAHLEKKNIDVTVVQNPYEIGYQTVHLLKAYIEDDQKTIDEMLPNKATTYDTGVRVIVPGEDSPVKGDNVLTIEKMKEWLSSKGLKSS
ncbi:substrate-binding domain-containing protein [Tundrisphaera sp. TA3]|uniref:substrate-binding domain-containing protein n=1 Tax=Tundrisphaera sp. TA3 TaxID=3435775 RepID=UPI003EBBCD7A